MPAESVNVGTDSEYQILEVHPGYPEIVTLSGVNGYAEHNDEQGYRICRFVYTGLDLANVSLPLEANPREPGSSKPVRQMKKTLENEPNMFHLFNNGMTLFATSCKPIYEENEITGVELTFDKEDQGICNGGHTYFACKRAFTEGLVNGQFSINAEVIILPENFTSEQVKRATVDISKSRNLNSQLAEASMADQLGYFNDLRKHLPNYVNKVSWHENDSKAEAGAIDASVLLRLMACLCPTKYQHSVYRPKGKSHKSASMTAKGNVWKPWIEAMEEGKTPKIAMMYPMAEEILRLRDDICLRLREDNFTSFRNTNLWQKYMCNPRDDGRGGTTYIAKDRDSLTDPGTAVVKLQTNVEVLILGLLRDNIARKLNENGKVTHVGWFLDPSKVLNLKFDHCMTSLSSDFRAANDEATVFCRNDSPYRAQMLTWDELTGAAPEESEWFALWELGTGNRIR